MAIRVRAAALVISQERLLAASHHGDGIWAPPGGGVDPGELSAEAAVRELKEETGLAGRALRLTHIVENTFEYGGRLCQEVCFYHLIEAEGARPSDGGFPGLEPHITLAWLSLSEIATTDLRPAALKAHLAPLPGHPVHLVQRP
ncbi:MAG: NUDIX hydrolase [Pikeienuella sp.]